MRTVFYLTLLLVWTAPVVAIAHPGKTDRQGGHKCWKECGEWELAHGEYHLHDKEYRPLRVDRPAASAAPVLDEPEPLPQPVQAGTEVSAETAPKPTSAKPGAAPSGRVTPVAGKEGLFPVDPYLLLLAALALILLLAVLLAARGRERRDRKS